MDVQLKKEFEWQHVKDKETKKRFGKNVDNALFQKPNESSYIFTKQQVHRLQLLQLREPFGKFPCTFKNVMSSFLENFNTCSKTGGVPNKLGAVPANSANFQLFQVKKNTMFCDIFVVKFCLVQSFW